MTDPILTSILPVSGWNSLAGSSVVIRHCTAEPDGKILCCCRPSSNREFPSAIRIWELTRSILKVENLQTDYFNSLRTELTALQKTAVTPLLTYWSYCSLALSHQYVCLTLKWCTCLNFTHKEDNSMLNTYGIMDQHLFGLLLVNSLKPSDAYMD